MKNILGALSNSIADDILILGWSNIDFLVIGAMFTVG